MCKRLGGHSAPTPFELPSTDRVTGSFGLKKLRTGAEEIEVYKHVNVSSSTSLQDHSQSF